MGVQAASLEVLEKAAVPPAQARAIVQAIEIEIAGASDTLATKQDTLSLRYETSALGVELRHEMAAMRVELRGEIAELGAQLRHEMAAMRVEFHAAMTSNVRHMYGAILGQFALLLGLAYFFVGHLQR